jgi:transposase
MVSTNIGRPLKLNDELIKKLCSYIRNGSYAVTACKCSGLSEVSYYAYIKQGEEDIEKGIESIFTKLLKSVKSAEAEAEHELASMVRETALDKKEWLPAMTFLERRHPERWGRRDRLQVDESKQIQINVVVKHYEELPPGQVIDGESRELLEPPSETPELATDLPDGEKNTGG